MGSSVTLRVMYGTYLDNEKIYETLPEDEEDMDWWVEKVLEGTGLGIFRFYDSWFIYLEKEYKSNYSNSLCLGNYEFTDKSEEFYISMPEVVFSFFSYGRDQELDWYAIADYG